MRTLLAQILQLNLVPANGVGVILGTISGRGVDITSESLVEVKERTQTRLSYIQCDVTDQESVRTAFAKAVEKARYPIRGLVALAGISGRSPAVDYDVDSFRKIMDINVTGTFLCARETARICHRQQTPGSIVLFASMSGTNVNRVLCIDLPR